MSKNERVFQVVEIPKIENSDCKEEMDKRISEIINDKTALFVSDMKAILSQMGYNVDVKVQILFGDKKR